MSNNNMKLNTYIREQTKIIAEAIKKGENSFDDFDFALKKISFKRINDTGGDSTVYGYDYNAYLEKLLEYKRICSIELKEINESDYGSVTRLQEAIDYLKREYEGMRMQKNRVNQTIDKYGKKR